MNQVAFREPTEVRQATIMQMPVIHNSVRRKQTSCCLIFTAAILLLASAAELGIGGYIATQSTKLHHHYIFLAGGSLSFLTSIIALFAGQDVDGRRGWVITAAAFGLIGALVIVPSFPMGFQAIDKNTMVADCFPPKCDIDLNVEFKLNIEDSKFGGIHCSWQCFENYEKVWQVLISISGLCGILNTLVFLTACCQYFIMCCCKKKMNPITILTPVNAVSEQMQTIPYSRLEN